jgi:hypothetical protein
MREVPRMIERKVAFKYVQENVKLFAKQVKYILVPPASLAIDNDWVAWEVVTTPMNVILKDIVKELFPCCGVFGLRTQKPGCDVDVRPW